MNLNSILEELFMHNEIQKQILNIIFINTCTRRQYLIFLQNLYSCVRWVSIDIIIAECFLFFFRNYIVFFFMLFYYSLVI